MKFNIATVSLILLAASSLAVPTPNDAKDLEGKAKEDNTKAKKVTDKQKANEKTKKNVEKNHKH
ncbi:12270_t:CDS:2, partial [Dentiscutata erythropus]